MAGRTAADGARTREVLVDAAAELFATLGIEGASIRSINSRAGLTPAAVHYHFGTKERLLDAVLERDGRAVHADIEEQVSVVAARRARPTTRQIVDVLAVPYQRLMEREPKRGVLWLRIVGQLAASQDDRLATGAQVALSSEAIQGLLRRRYPSASPGDLDVHWRLAAGALIQMLALTPAREVGRPGSTYQRAVINFVAGGLDASLAAVGRAAAAS